MANNFVFNDSLPVAPLKLAALESCKDFASKVDSHIVQFRRNDMEELKRRKADLHYRGYDVDSYLLDFECPRFGTGEAKAVINESVRGTDIFVMADVMNYSIPYTVCGYTNHMSPDDHFQDMKRVIGSCVATAHRVNVVMPFLYESRQHKRSKRESLDCAMALEELIQMGVENIITFDAHDARVQNATPLHGFETIQPAYQFMKALLKNEKGLHIDNDHFMIISPDEGSMNRAIYLANVLGVDMGMYYRRLDYTRTVKGRHPIAAYEFLGPKLEGKDMILIDDMISSGDSIIEVATELKRRKAKRIFAAATFGLFTNGMEKFDKAYEEGIIDGILTTNLIYQTPNLLSKPYYINCDMSKYIALIIDTLNHDGSLSEILSPNERIQNVLQKYKNGETI